MPYLFPVLLKKDDDILAYHVFPLYLLNIKSSFTDSLLQGVSFLYILFLSVPFSSGGGWEAGSSAQPPVDLMGCGSVQCSASVQSQGRKGSSTQWSASIFLNPNL